MEPMQNSDYLDEANQTTSKRRNKKLLLVGQQGVKTDQQFSQICNTASCVGGQEQLGVCRPQTEKILQCEHLCVGVDAQVRMTNHVCGWQEAKTKTLQHFRAGLRDDQMHRMSNKPVSCRGFPLVLSCDSWFCNRDLQFIYLINLL